MATENENKQVEVLRRVALELSRVTFDETPPEVAHRVHPIVREVTGNDDPYSKVKDKYNRIAMKMYPGLKRRVAESEDRLLTAVRLAIAGNIIDFGPGLEFDLEETIEEPLFIQISILFLFGG